MKYMPASIRFPGISRFLPVALLLVCLSGAGQTSAQEIARETIDTVSKATFEVVLLKPSDANLAYERPLPMELIPFALRNDPYFSVGTAFAIGNNEWVTAAHVLNIGKKSQAKTYRLRDASGKVYDLDRILKYSHERDFVVFSIKNPPEIKPLAVNRSPQMNDKVYAVGNALGEGIVFRDGLYTSSTPEEQDGRWKWMRFSAAASPGNSGGPLLDSDGQVVGVVVMKSENENLNYALPISELLDAAKDTASVDSLILYTIENMPGLSAQARMTETVALPKTYEALDSQLTKDFYDFGYKLEERFFSDQKAAAFPDSEDARQVLYSDYDVEGMPGLLARSEDGLWKLFTPQKSENFDLGQNGDMTRGQLGSSMFIRVKKPDDVKLADLYKNSKLLMELILRGYPLHRTIGKENIKITSMGKAVEEYIYPDHFGRKWFVRIWNVGFSDEQAVLFALLTPNGFKGMLQVESTGDVPGHVDDLKMLADCTYLSYYGTFAEWQDFLAQKDLLPDALSTIHVTFDYDKQFSYSSRRLSFSYTPDEMRITKDSDMKIRLGYFLDNGKVVWDVKGVVAGEHKDNLVHLSLSRANRPADKLDDKFKSEWTKIVARDYPYNRTAYFTDKQTVIGSVVVSSAAGDMPADNQQVLYTAFYGADGNLDHDVVAKKFDRFLAKIRILEK